jgi:hypothetical protein
MTIAWKKSRGSAMESLLGMRCRPWWTRSSSWDTSSPANTPAKWVTKCPTLLKSANDVSSFCAPGDVKFALEGELPEIAENLPEPEREKRGQTNKEKIEKAKTVKQFYGELKGFYN